MVSTDHCPFCFKEQKELGLGDFSKIPNGIGGVEHRMDLLYQGVVDGRISLSRWVELCCTTPARMFGLHPRKGEILPGADADIVVYDPAARTRISVDTHHMNMDHSAYEGYEIAGGVDTVLSRGRVVVEKGTFHGQQGARPVPAPRALAVPRLTVTDPRRTAWISASCCSATPRRGGWSTSRRRPSSPASPTCGPSTRTCSGRSRTSSTARSSPQTHRVIVGPMVTNPATRDWTVTASTFATLNDMFGNRTVCGIGRGDSAVRVINGKPVTLAELRESIDVIRELASSRATAYKDSHLQFPWSHGSELPVYVAAYGPKALALAGEVGDGFILQLADLSIAEWSINAVRAAAEAAGRDPASVRICVAAPAYVGDDLAHQRDQVRWFGGMVGNHVADIVERYGADGAAVPQALTDYIKNRQGYDYNEHGRAGNTHTEFVPDEIVDRFCVLGPAQAHIDKLVGAQGARRRPVRDLPAARRAGVDARGLRPDRHPGAGRAHPRPHLTTRAARVRGGRRSPSIVTGLPFESTLSFTVPPTRPETA